MNANVRWLLSVPLLLLAASCGGGDTGGNAPGTGGDCVLGGKPASAGSTCCNGMTSTSTTAGDQGICRQPVGGPCYSDDNINSIPSGKSCCNAFGSATYLGTVGICNVPSQNCAGNASCLVGSVCFSSGFCGGSCLTVGQGAASAQFPCCPGLAANSAGTCYPPAGHLCNTNEDCLSRVCIPSGTVAKCQ
jgi:hypothetical protein